MSHKAGKKIFSLLFILFFCLSSNAQREATQEKLAIQYLEQKEFEKANVYLDLLYDGAPDRWYSDYYRSLLNTKSYDVAEKNSKEAYTRPPARRLSVCSSWACV